MDSAAASSRLDEALARFHQTGPEFLGWLANHGPMASDALVRLGGADRLNQWANCYAERLQEPPSPRWVIPAEQWREAWGDPARLGDWLLFFDRALTERPWPEVLAEFWPQLISGAAASATHGLIRTGHAVRALSAANSSVRLTELAHALGYWAARWQPLGATTPGMAQEAGRQPNAQGVADLLHMAGGLLQPDPSWGFRPRLRELQEHPRWAVLCDELGQIPQDIPAAVNTLVKAGISHYAQWGASDPVMLVHAITAPRAASWVLPHLPTDSWGETWVHVSRSAAALSAIYPAQAWPHSEPESPAGHELGPAAVQHGDEHVLKLAEAVLDPSYSHPLAATALHQALISIPPLPRYCGGRSSATRA